jgi:hypothetical protein
MRTIRIYAVACGLGVLSAQDLPKDAASQIRTAWAEARKTWKTDAKFLHFGMERESAKEGFQSDFAFGVDSMAGLYHISRGPKGASAKFVPPDEHIVICMLNSKVIDPAQAVAAARAHGMKGSVLKVALECWGVPVATEVWRVVADNDPSTTDPNDPNMRNHIVDAVSGAYYGTYFAPVNIDVFAFGQSATAYLSTAIAEYMEGVRAARR